MKKRINTALAFLITVIALYFSFKKVDFSLMIKQILSGRYIFIIPAFILLMVYCYLRAVRWGVLLGKKISIFRLFSATMIGFMGNCIFPAKAGEFLKAYILGRREKISKTACLATVVLERIWDGIALIFILISAFLYFRLTNDHIIDRLAEFMPVKWVAAVFISFFIIAFVFIVLFELYSQRIIYFFDKILRKVWLKKADFIKIRLEKFSEGISIIKKPTDIANIFLLSLLIWLSAALTIYVMLDVFSITIPIMGSLFILVVLGFFMMIPSIGSLGTMQMAFIIGLGAYGVDKSQALSFSIVYQFFDTFPVVLIGLFYFWKDGLNFKLMNETKDI